MKKSESVRRKSQNLVLFLTSAAASSLRSLYLFISWLMKKTRKKKKQHFITRSTNDESDGREEADGGAGYGSPAGGVAVAVELR